MKKLLVLLLLSSAFVLSAKGPKKELKKGLEFETSVYDYGKIEKKSPGKCIFKFTNVDIVPVVISKVKTSCGCTSPLWPKTPIEPGDSGEIEVIYNTKLVGPFTKTITVSSSAGQSIVLMIKGEVLK